MTPVIPTVTKAGPRILENKLRRGSTSLSCTHSARLNPMTAIKGICKSSQGQYDLNVESPNVFAICREVINKCYRLDNSIRSGTLAQVYLADDIRVRKQTIVKVFDAPFRSGTTFKTIFQISLRDLARTSHPTSLKFWIGDQGDLLHVCTRILAGGDLRAMLQQDSSLSVAQITLIMMEILKGTSYLQGERQSPWRLET